MNANHESGTPSPPAMEARGVTAGYGKYPIIHDVTAQFVAGSVVSLLGPNGAGKSTFLKALFGLAPMSGGSILVSGQLVAPVARQLVRLGVSYVPQIGSVFPSLTVRENLLVGTYVRQGGSLEHVFEVFPDLKSVMKKRAGRLSGGQRSMLAVARALMSDPKVLLLDEATGGLSPLVARRLLDHVSQLAKSGVAIAMVEQNVSLAIEFSDWAYVFVNGRISFSGSARQLNEPEEVAQLFLGSSSV